MRIRAHVQPHIVADSLEPIDLARLEDKYAVIALHEKAGGRERRRRGAQQFPDLLAMSFLRCAAAQKKSGARDRLTYALFAERLEQIIHGLRLEGLQRKLVEGRDEDYYRQPLLFEGAQDFEAVHARH